jgi:HD-like signal output (HDOD) protein/ActR/RegA family two-component response regulator
MDVALAVSDTAVRRVLVVDADVDQFGCLRDELAVRRPSWHLAFAGCGAAALAAFDDGAVDVVVTDLRLSDMDGAALLTQVQRLSPATIRIVRSDQADGRAVARAVAGAHRFLAKSCSAEDLAAVLERSFEVCAASQSVGVSRGAAATTSLPSCPGIYHELAAATDDPTSGADAIARLIEHDTAMTAKVLQLANSAFFGIGRPVSRVNEAVTHLGTDILKALALSTQAFANLQPTVTSTRFSLDVFQTHASLVARLAAAILPDPDARHEAVTAAVLHDIGVLVLLRDDPWRWEDHTEMAAREGLPLHVVEARELGADHGAYGGHLLSLWGLPHPIVEAVANHHVPGRLAGTKLDCVAAVHIADALAHEVEPSGGGGHTSVALLDMDYVEELGVAPQLDGWRDLARRAAG